MREIPQNQYALEAKGKKKVPRNGLQIIGKWVQVLCEFQAQH
jgi:hypothetical protein